MHLSSVNQPTAVPTSDTGRSAQIEPQRPAGIIPGFDASERRFGENFDCSTHAAVIKMMMMTFGRTPSMMFEQVRPIPDGYAITMKDEFKVEVTRDELKLAAATSRFTGADNVAVRDANFMFAAFVKRKQVTGGFADFATALAKTLEGETALRCLQGLGVYGLAQYVPAQQMVGEGRVGGVGNS